MHVDVIVLGGGIIGASAAYELAKEGAKVALLDKNRFGSGASGSSAAMLEFQLEAGRGEPFFSLPRASNALFPQLEAEIKALTGLGFDYDPCGILQVALTPEEADLLRQEVERQARLGLRAEWWSAEALVKKLPQLSPTNFGGAFFAEDGQVDAPKFLAAMLKAAEAGGVVSYEEEGEISLLLSEHGKVVGVSSGRKTLTAERIVIASGAWTDSLLSPLGIRLGIEPVRGQLAVYDSPNKALPHPVYTKGGVYLVPKQGYLLAGTTTEFVGFDNRTTPEGRSFIAESVGKLMPSLVPWPLRHMTAGLRPGTPDGLPFLGPLPEFENVIIVAGHYRNGVLLAPITARIVSALCQGRKPPVSITPFSPERGLYLSHGRTSDRF